MSYAYSKVIIGFEVRREDFYTVKYVGKKCKYNHENQTDTYCSKCGTMLEDEYSYTPTDVLLKVCNGSHSRNVLDWSLGIPHLIKVEGNYTNRQPSFYLGLTILDHPACGIATEYLPSIQENIERATRIRDWVFPEEKDNRAIKFVHNFNYKDGEYIWK